MTVLDNPLWSSLTGAHKPFATGGSTLKVYPWEMVPFAAVPSADVILTDELLRDTLGFRPFVYFVGTLPRIESSTHELMPLPEIVQMVRPQRHDDMLKATPAFRQLTADDVPAMIELTQRVYPAYFRERTIEMGEYLGVFDGDALVAMAGLRMAPEGYREISGVATDPAYGGRGYAAALCSELAKHVIAQGKTPMLHFDADNVRAQRLYEKLGFSVRAHVAMCRVVSRERVEQAHLGRVHPSPRISLEEPG